MKILSVVGARPQFIKASTVSRRLKDERFRGLSEAIVHTGQHYDDAMSGAFFRELEIPEPRWNLAVGSGPHGAQTGRMMERLEGVASDYKPDVILVYGYTNSTLAGALVAAKSGVTLAHVEAGLRSFRRAMPEEINRAVTDRVSDTLFCPTQQAIDNLKAEGRTKGVHLVGDVMYDAFLHAAKRCTPEIVERFGLEPGRYVLATIHRAENTDQRERLATLFDALSHVATTTPVLLPIHPRTAVLLSDAGIGPKHNLKLVDPVPHAELLSLIMYAAVVATDSGGMQKEAYLAGVPCVTLRDETEWTETLAGGWNRLPRMDAAGIVEAISAASGMSRSVRPPPVFGDGNAAAAILEVLAGRR